MESAVEVYGGASSLELLRLGDLNGAENAADREVLGSRAVGVANAFGVLEWCAPSSGRYEAT